MANPLFNSLPFRLDHAVRGIVVGVIFVSVLVLVGWTWDVEYLKRVLPGLIAMNPVTALTFIVAALSLWLQRRQSSPAIARAANIGAGFVLVVGILKVTSFGLPELFPVDRLLFAEKLDLDPHAMPNSMAPNTALCFVLLGWTLLLLDSRHWWPSHLFAITIALISLVALIGYTYRVRWLYGIGNLMPIALHTALLFQCLALAVFFIRPQRGLMAIVTSATPGGNLARLLFPGMVAILWILGWLRIEGERRGFYEPELGVALNTAASIALFGLLIWWSVASLHRAEADRKKVTAERERFFSLSLDMLCIAGTDGYFKRLNPAFSHTLGFDTGDLLSRPFIDLVHPEDRAATAAELERLSQGNPTLQFENRYACKDGSWKWLSWKAQTFPAEGLIYATAREVTLQKQAEADIRQLNSDLESRARQLEQANQELESFSYSVSHDLRAPLRHVQGYVDMLTKSLDGQLGGKPLHYLRTISDASVEMGNLIDDLLAFSRMGRTELHQGSVNLNTLIEELLPSLEADAKGRQINWQIAALPPVFGDASMLKQLLANLIGNAVKYTRRSDPSRIEIGIAGEEDGRPVFFIRDNGAGFDMRYAHKLFGVFQRLHRSEEFEGTGIGLAIVRRIVSRHAGRTWAEGALNQGATFYFTLIRAGD